jgi:hypothetical protein
MSDDSIFGLGLLAGAVFGVFLTMYLVNDSSRAAAIQHGVADWRVDAKTGETEFVYLPPCTHRSAPTTEKVEK